MQFYFLLCLRLFTSCQVCVEAVHLSHVVPVPHLQKGGQARALSVTARAQERAPLGLVELFAARESNGPRPRARRAAAKREVTAKCAASRQQRAFQTEAKEMPKPEAMTTSFMKLIPGRTVAPYTIFRSRGLAPFLRSAQGLRYTKNASKNAPCARDV